MMKSNWIRIVSSVVLAVCLSLSVAVGFGESQQPAATAFRLENIAIDGKLDDWNTSAPIELSDIAQLVRDGFFWNGPDDLSAQVYVGWDESYLYLAADVTEDSVFGAIETLPLDGMDNFEVFISTNPGDDPARTEYATHDFMFYLIMDGEYWDTAFDRSMVPKDNRQRFISKGLDGGENVLEGYECAAERTTTGFAYECKIPWICFSNENIAVYTPKSGDTVNFDFLITDISYPCPGTEFVPQIAWTGDLGIKTNPSLWGRLTFE